MNTAPTWREPSVSSPSSTDVALHRYPANPGRCRRNGFKSRLSRGNGCRQAIFAERSSGFVRLRFCQGRRHARDGCSTCRLPVHVDGRHGVDGAARLRRRLPEADLRDLGQAAGTRRQTHRQAGDARRPRLYRIPLARRVVRPLRPFICGVRTAGCGRQADDPAVYRPVSGWRPGRALRRRIRADAGAAGAGLQRLHFPCLGRLPGFADAKTSTSGFSPRSTRRWRTRRNGGCSASTATILPLRWARSPACANPRTATSRHSPTSTPTSRRTATEHSAGSPAATRLGLWSWALRHRDQPALPLAE